jgi:serine protease Do
MALMAAPKAPVPPRPNGRGPKPPGELKPAEATLPKDELPAEYKKLLEKKTGYANYYFNKLEQQRVLVGLAPFAGWQAVTGKWILNGRTADGDAFQMKLLPQALTAQFTKRAPGLQNLDGTDFLDEPPGSGGLLAALYQFKLLLTEGAAGFTEFSYYGSQPLDGRATMVDVIITKKSTIECRWYFRATDGALVGFDSSLGGDMDSSEIRFLQFDEFQGRRFPSQFAVRYGDTEYGVFDVQSMELAVPGEPNKPPK